MSLEQAAGGTVQAVVVYDGRLLMVAEHAEHEDWELPAGTPEPAESPHATAERVVYELTGYLVDGSQALEPREAGEPVAVAAVVCQLLSESPSGGGSLPAEQQRWAPFAEAARLPLPGAVRDYLQGHTPV
ncbi:NUDIX hydrolase [Streptomyces sp. NBC_00820]|uniref:NUDIX hydrolase n=1 Tax=Streptomyces sp. NBC_00820 TaxID=2975842 RepID=UPI002ED1811C|nr:NUDIX hydrolase [Streptomyces sp. NBC_00820]